MKSALLGERAAMPQAELVGGESAREVEHFVAACAPASRARSGTPRLVQSFLGEPEPADVLDAVERDAAGDRVALAEVSTTRCTCAMSRRTTSAAHKRQLIEANRKAQTAHETRRRFSVRAEKVANGAKERSRLLDIRHVAASSITTSVAPIARAAASDDASGMGSWRPCTISVGTDIESSCPGASRS